MRCCLMLLKVVNRILDWLGRIVGCWIDASEFFSFLCVMVFTKCVLFVIGFGKVCLRFLRSDYKPLTFSVFNF